jgi:hypothetical protein
MTMPSNHPGFSSNCKTQFPHPTSIRNVFKNLARDPGRYFLKQWNWKAALMSALARGIIFFTVNIGASLDAATSAMTTEFLYRILAAGLYGALTQAFRHVEPFWKAIVCTMILLPGLSHTVEFIIHYYRGTESLGWSILFSVCFTACTTTFNLFAMRRGILVVDESNSSLLNDFRALPGVLFAYLISIRIPLRHLSNFLWTRIDPSCK